MEATAVAAEPRINYLNNDYGWKSWLFTLDHKRIAILSKDFCMCATMYRISPQNLLWALESVLSGEPVNVIRVPEATKRWAKTALDRMLQVR